LATELPPNFKTCISFIYVCDVKIVTAIFMYEKQQSSKDNMKLCNPYRVVPVVIIVMPIAGNAIDDWDEKICNCTCTTFCKG
jgi:hypothetical protein